LCTEHAISAPLVIRKVNVATHAPFAQMLTLDLMDRAHNALMARFQTGGGHHAYHVARILQEWVVYAFHVSERKLAWCHLQTIHGVYAVLGTTIV
jgi:hypothetical protein